MLGSREALAGPLSNLACTELEQGHYPRARSLLEEALTINRETGNHQWEAVNLNNLSNVAGRCSDYPLARSCYDAALVIHRELGNRRGISIALGNLGNQARRKGDYGAARDQFEEGLGIAREIGDSRVIVHWLIGLGHLHIETADRDAARSMLAEAFPLIVESHLLMKAEEALRQVAWIACKTTNGTIAASVPLPTQARAARLCGASENLRQASDVRNAVDQDDEKFVAMLRAGLGDQPFNSAWKEGRAMSFEDAVACARAEVSQRHQTFDSGNHAAHG